MLELVLEWGIPYKGTSFSDTPVEIVGKILDYRRAKILGLQHARAISDNNNKLNKAING